jgi:uncharacterized membrane protein YeaQ/YmgE (transglycosylase-associated protein family)
MNILAWLVLGTIAGYVAGLIVKGDESLGLVGHVVLGIAGALVGGFATTLLFGLDPITNPIELPSVIAAVAGSVVLVWVAGAVSGKPRTGSGVL